ncbi:MAG: adenylyl-sulfate kinase [Alphaproteobacteria bacterium]|nr:adenylyl-sulfate kinase [Alphaproteobacteria bacterium]
MSHETPDRLQPQPPLPIVIVGHVDHGKSTLIGRLLHDTGSLPDGKFEELRRQSDRRGVAFEWSFVMDAFQIERDQGITVDTSRIWFTSEHRDYVIIDAPGHKEFLKNMVTGAAGADAAILVIDAVQGVSEQTRRHAYLLSLLGVAQIVVTVNKMDLVGYSRQRFEAVAAEIRGYLANLDVVPETVIPIVARDGDNLTGAEAGEATAMPWWQGPSLVEALDGFRPRPALLDQPLRLPVQDIYRHGDSRIVVGRVESGRLRVGDSVSFSPGQQVARVQSIRSWGSPEHVSAAAGQAVALTLDDEIFVERGHIAAPPESPPQQDNVLQVRLFWLDEVPLEAGDRLIMKLATGRHTVFVQSLDRVIDIEDLKSGLADRVAQNGVAQVTLRSQSKVAFDPHDAIAATGRAVLVRNHRIVGGCVVEAAAQAAASRNLTSVPQTVSGEERALANGHRGGVLWLTGLSGSGKSTLAMALQRRLFERGQQVYVLDGDNVRQGLNRDLGFSPVERSENIRRIAEVARLFADSGTLVVTAFISPYREDRDIARDIIADGFREVYVEADLAICEERDPKGLYKRARAGEIADFTGISAPYEEPVSPDLRLDTGSLSVDAALTVLVEEIDRAFMTPRGERRAAG